jgi:hypothetical protein
MKLSFTQIVAGMFIGVGIMGLLTKREESK